MNAHCKAFLGAFLITCLIAGIVVGVVLGFASASRDYYFNNLTETQLCELLNLNHHAWYEAVPSVGDTKVTRVSYSVLFRHTNQFNDELDRLGIVHYRNANEALLCK